MLSFCRSAASPEEAAIAWDAFAIGGVTAGAAHAHEEFGVTVDLLADENVVGLISPGQVNILASLTLAGGCIQQTFRRARLGSRRDVVTSILLGR